MGDNDFLYHFTCRFHLHSILAERRLSLTTSNFSLENLSLYPVVWLTDSPTPDNMGLLFDENIPIEFNKTHIRIALYKEPYMMQWDKWSESKGMDKATKQILINTANAQETYKTWYVSEREIPLDDVMFIEDMTTGYLLWENGEDEEW
jgi:hypothetical protein